MLSALAYILEPVRPAVLLVEPGRAVSEATRHAALALGRVGAVEERDMLVSDVAEPNWEIVLAFSHFKNSVYASAGARRTSESCSSPQTSLGQCYGQGRRPSARRRSRRRGRGG